ncbi:AAA family ATPase [Ruegeria arenilitoris]|uniref:AAA family ATPase n=1 Tax=Ruegeria arenilitoris TaxID=1173585 RepID=UPI00147DF376|nr:AAA family ATPase [Ruegeria arenilitoris]
MNFVVIPKNGNVPSEGRDTVYLKVDQWNDYSFYTMFEVFVFDGEGNLHELSNTKIGFSGQTESVSTFSTLPGTFTELPENYFSLGVDVDYYYYIASTFSESFGRSLLNSLRDVVLLPSSLALAKDQKVFQISHLRSVSLIAIEAQFTRVLAGGKPITDFEFCFKLDKTFELAGFSLDFDISAHSKPSTNIHAIIGRNGVGKTSLMNSMIHAITDGTFQAARFEQPSLTGSQEIGRDFFSSLVSVSFSAFDPFTPPPDQPDPSKGICYFYVGLKDYSDSAGSVLKPLSDLHKEFADSLDLCFGDPGKKKRWISAVKTLETDQNFADMNLSTLAKLEQDHLEENALRSIKVMSSGHAIVLLTVTKLIAHVEEKALVLVDEPESHLHPPLLSAFIRILSNILFDQNAVAIVATHSPVVLQEVPRSCVWKINRSGLASSWNRPEIETFGENVGILTREIFGLEVSKSGFNSILQKEALATRNYEKILSDFSNQIGLEGRAILRSILEKRDQ